MNSMMPLKGFTVLLLFQAAGELLTRIAHLPFPGPVLGMLLLTPCLVSRAIREPVEACANFLLSHLSLLFIPVSVGLMTQLTLLRAYGIQLVLVLVISCMVGLLVTGWLLSWLLPAEEGAHEPIAKSSEKKAEASGQESAS